MAETQGELFPEDKPKKKPKKKSKTTPAQKTAAQQRKKNRAANKTRRHNRRISREARERENAARKARGEGELNSDAFQMARTSLKILNNPATKWLGRQGLRIGQAYMASRLLR